jgi:hypothetical protein
LQYNDRLFAQQKEQRSQAIRTAIRQAITAEQAHPARGDLDLEAIRSVVAEEIERALVMRHISAGPGPAQIEEDDLEARFGSKLDRMMGGLAVNSDLGEDEFQ